MEAQSSEKFRRLCFLCKKMNNLVRITNTFPENKKI